MTTRKSNNRVTSSRKNATKKVATKRSPRKLSTKVTVKSSDELSTAIKYDSGKVRMDLIPPLAEVEIAKVFTYGANKYNDWNWSKGMDPVRLEAAIKRHLAEWKLGYDNDPETGLSHLAHAGCGLMMLLETELLRLHPDTRQSLYNQLVNNPTKL
jgi:hypothetical protein